MVAIATAEVLDEPIHSMHPCSNFLSAHPWSDLHTDVLRLILSAHDSPCEPWISRAAARPAICLRRVSAIVRVPPAARFPEYLHRRLNPRHFPPVHQPPKPRQIHVRPPSRPVEGDFFTHGPGIDEPLVLHAQNPTTGEIESDFYAADHLGSVTDLISKDGSISGEAVYNSFGKIVARSGNLLDQPYFYTSRELCPFF